MHRLVPEAIRFLDGTAANSNLPILEGFPMSKRKWHLLNSNPAYLGGSPRIDGMRLTTEHVYQYYAGSDSDAHVKMLQKSWPTQNRSSRRSRLRRCAGESEKTDSAIRPSGIAVQFRNMRGVESGYSKSYIDWRGVKNESRAGCPACKKGSNTSGIHESHYS